MTITKNGDHQSEIKQPSIQLFLEAINGWFIFRVLLAIIIFVCLLLYDDYHPSFFDPFSLSEDYPLGIFAALISSFFLDWFGYGAFVLPIFLVLCQLNAANLWKKTMLSILLMVDIIMLVGIFSPSLYLATKFSGIIGYIGLEFSGSILFRLFLAAFLGLNLVLLLRFVNKDFPTLILIRIVGYKLFEASFKSPKIFSRSSDLDNNNQPRPKPKLKTKSKIMAREEFNAFIDGISEDSDQNDSKSK